MGGYLMEPLHTRPINGKPAQVYIEALHPRDSDGKWRKAYNKVTRPPVRGPRSMSRVNSINRVVVKSRSGRTGAGKSRWQRVVGVVNTIRHPYYTWRKARIKQLRSRAKRDSKQRGIR